MCLLEGYSHVAIATAIWKMPLVGCMGFSIIVVITRCHLLNPMQPICDKKITVAILPSEQTLYHFDQ